MEETKKTAEGTAAIETRLEIIATYLSAIHYNMVFGERGFDRMKHYRDVVSTVDQLKGLSLSQSNASPIAASSKAMNPS